MGWRDNLRVLGLADLRWVFTATVVSNLGDGIVTIALAFAVLDLTHSATDLGVIFAARLATQVAMVLLGGVVADRVSRRRVMIGTDLVRMTGQLVMGCLLITNVATFWELVLSQAILGGASAFFQPASLGLIPAVAGDYRQEANALRGMAQAGSSILGPALGALIVTLIGAKWGLLADALSYALSALAISAVSRAAAAVPADSAGPRRSVLGDLRDGFGEVRARTWVWVCILCFGLTNAVSTAWDVYEPLAMRRWYHGASSYALYSIAGALGAIIGGAVLLRHRPRRPLLVGTLSLLPGVVPFALLSLRVGLGIVVPLQVILSVGSIAFNTLWWTALQDHVPAAAISRVVSFDYAGSYLLMPLGSALSGPLATALGLRWAMLATAIGCGALILTTLAAPDVRNLRTVPAAPDIVSA